MEGAPEKDKDPLDLTAKDLEEIAERNGLDIALKLARSTLRALLRVAKDIQEQETVSGGLVPLEAWNKERRDLLNERIAEIDDFIDTHTRENES